MNQPAPSTRKLMKLAQNALDKLRTQEALNLLLEVIKLNPNHVDALHQSAMILHNGGYYEQAMEFYQRAIGIDPTHVKSYIMLSALLESRNQWDRAKEIVELAVTMAPDDPGAHAALVSFRLKLQSAHLVPDYLEKILPKFPQNLELQQFYAIALKINNRRAEADAVYSKICSEFRVPASFRVIYETYMPRFYRSVDEIDDYRAAFSASIERFIIEKPQINIGMLSNHPLFALAYHNRDNKALLARYTQMLRLCAPELNYVAPHCKLKATSSRDPIRIGFISQYMHNHSVGNCYRKIMLNLKKQPGFEITFFNLANVMDEKIQEIIDAGVPIVSLPKNLTAVHKTVADKQFDLLIYTDIGMNATAHYMAMARLAPYQACFQGHPETTGIDTMDYVISSRSYEPANADENYTERLLCNPGIDTVFERPTPPERWLTRAELGLPEDKKLYVCPMAIQKIHPDFDGLLADILARDPHAVIVLFNDFMQQMASNLLQQRILNQCDPARVIFLKWQSSEKLFSILNEADAILDTIYFGGGTTAQYCFAFGFPIVTAPGRYARGRVVLSYYDIMEISQPPVAANLDEYAAIAVKLAKDEDYKQQLREEIRAKNHRMFEADAHRYDPVQLVTDIITQNLDAYRR